MEASQAFRSSGWRSCTSAKVRPSQAPKSSSRSPSSIRTGRPNRSATASAVSRVRSIGELTTASTVPRAASASAARSACQRPFSESCGSLPVLPENRFCGVSAVSPCRSMTSVVAIA